MPPACCGLKQRRSAANATEQRPQRLPASRASASGSSRFASARGGRGVRLGTRRAEWAHRPCCRGAARGAHDPVASTEAAINPPDRRRFVCPTSRVRASRPAGRGRQSAPVRLSLAGNNALRRFWPHRRVGSSHVVAVDRLSAIAIQDAADRYVGSLPPGRTLGLFCHVGSGPENDADAGHHCGRGNRFGELGNHRGLRRRLGRLRQPKSSTLTVHRRRLDRGRRMGEVYKARDSKLDRDVAIKVLPATPVARPGSARAVRSRSKNPRGAQPSEHRARSWPGRNRLEHRARDGVRGRRRSVAASRARPNAR